MPLIICQKDNYRMRLQDGKYTCPKCDNQVTYEKTTTEKYMEFMKR